MATQTEFATKVAWDEACQTYLSLIYQEIKSSVNYSIDEKLSAMRQQIALTYGEILFQGFEKLRHHFPITENDVFVDCGSGLGKLCLQVFLSTEAKEVVGIEVEPALAALSRQILQRTKKELPDFFAEQKLTLIESSFLDVIVDDATMMFSCSTCFTEEMMNLIGLWMNKHPKLHTVMSLKPLSSLELPFYRTVEVECTWDTALCYVYKRI